MAKPRFLRRHYPHQVQGVRSTFRADHLSQAAPPHSILGQNKTHPSEVNKVDICRAPVSGAGFGLSQKRPTRAGDTPAAPEISGNDDGGFERRGRRRSRGRCRRRKSRFADELDQACIHFLNNAFRTINTFNGQRYALLPIISD